jgi:coproporphyrinogen III oxidase
MPVVPAASARALRAHDLVRDLQARLVRGLEGVSGPGGRFEPIAWLRDEGRHGGGVRYEDSARGFFNRASANVS